MKLILSCLFLTLPFQNIVIADILTLYEIFLLAGLVILFAQIAMRKIEIRLVISDVLVFAYAIIFLMAVFNYSESFYNAARNYRWLVLTPVTIYALIRFCPLSVSTLNNLALLIIPGCLWQGTFLFIRFLEGYGLRPEYFAEYSSPVTLSFLFAFCAFIVFFTKPKKGNIYIAVIRWLLFSVMIIFLIITYQRAIFIGFISLMTLWIWLKDNSKLRILFSKIIFISLIGILALILSNVPFRSDVSYMEIRGLQKTHERLVSVELYLADIENRLSLWQNAAHQAIATNPFWGMGMDSWDITSSNVAEMYYGTAHSAMVSSIRLAGLSGLISLLAVILTTYNAFNRASETSTPLNNMWKISYLSFSLLLLLVLTNDFSGGRATLFFFLVALAVKSNEFLADT